MTKKKKFPLPRPGSYMKSKSSGSGGSELDNSDRGNIHRSPPSSSSTPRFGRKPSFRFGRKKKGEFVGSPTSDGGGNGADTDESPYSVKTEGSAIISNDNEQQQQQQQPPPLPAPTSSPSSSTKQMIKNNNSNNKPPLPQRSVSDSVTKSSSSSYKPPYTPKSSNTTTPLTRTRSLTPSDYHYHTTPTGGCNASLTPISHHYQTNEALLDLFTTLYYEQKEENDQSFSVAYAVGIKFVEVAMFTIPQHGYYKSNYHSNERKQSVVDAVRVTQLLGGMVDDIMQEEDNNGSGGSVERVEQLEHLVNVANSSLEKMSKEEDDDDGGLKQESRSCNNPDGMTLQMSRLWKDCIMGGGDDEPDGTNGCSSLPDNLCSFWNTVGKNCVDVVNEAVVMSEDDEDDTTDIDRIMEQRSHDKEQQQQQQQGKKRPRVDCESLPRPPEAMEIPQLFIKKEESLVRKSHSSDADAVNAAGREGKESSSRNHLVKEVSGSSSSSDIDIIQEQIVPDVMKAVTDTRAIESAQKQQQQQDEEDRGESPPSIFTDGPDSDTPMEDSTNGIKQPIGVQGRPMATHTQNPLTNDEGFDKAAFQLALSRSMSMQGGDSSANIAVVSSSSSIGEMQSTIPTNSIDNQQQQQQSGSGGKNGDDNVASLISLYQEQYHTLKEKDKFHVRFLDTYQGRNPNSTNGCTVIAPLTCIQYFTSIEQNNLSTQELTWNNGVPDDLINQVIDVQAATILPEVRGKLNLDQDSFIIPSDVHDHLIDVGLLSTTQFVGVCGGNILNDEHLMSFKRSLLLLDDERERKRLKGRKIAATFFFHGHVVALHVVNESNDAEDVWIELIDSLPNPENWIRPLQSSRIVTPESSDYEEREPSHATSNRWNDYMNDGEWERPVENDNDDELLPMNAVRVRCTDVEHFDTLIRHYAISKFSEEEQQFVDNTVWDDVNGYCESAFDPRVFQAFIWCEAE